MKMKHLSSFTVLVLIVLLFLSLPHILKGFLPLYFPDLIAYYGDSFGVDPALIAAVIQVESSFRKEVVSPKGAVGLMQLMPDTAAWLAEQRGQVLVGADLLQPEVNIELGTYYLKYLLDRFPTEHSALAAYNGGPTNARRWLEEDLWDGSWERTGRIPFSETRSYVRKVGTMRRLYHFLYQQELKLGRS